MIGILSNSFDPTFNLATEEYLLKNRTDDFFLLWRSEPTVIVGKHQNALAEINYTYLRERGIQLARRLTGGGTVVHDLQNLNFTYICNTQEGKHIDFKRYIEPIIGFLKSLGLDAHIGKTNDIRLGELKISGNAEHVYKNRTLHHGTLLFNSDLNQLRRAIQTTPGRYTDKAVQSNRASVTNIAMHLKNKISVEDFTSSLFKYLSELHQAQKGSLNKEDIRVITQLAKEKYRSPQWIWSYSPKYTFQHSLDLNGTIWNINLSVESGIISASGIENNKSKSEWHGILNGCLHRYEELDQNLSKHHELKESIGSNWNQFVEAFF